MVATNKQMVDLTYLCFVFLNDRSDAWWEMQWDACQGRDNSRERARESCIHSQFTPISAVFKVSNFFFFWIIIGCCESSCSPASFPSELPSAHWQTGSWWGKLTACMRRSNSAMKLMCCIKGGICGGPQGGGGGPGSNPVWDPLETGSGGARLNVGSRSLVLSLFIYSLILLFINLFIPVPRRNCLVLAAHNNLAASHSLK